MCASRWSAVGPQFLVVALIGLGVASCSSDSDRFSDIFSADSLPRSETTGSIPPSTGHVDSKPLPHLASNSGEGTSGGGRGMGSYQPGNSDVTGSLPPAAPPPPAWTWEGGTAVTLAPGETLEMLAKRHGVPVAVLMEANSITSPGQVRPGQHLVIPRYRGPATALSAPQTRIASSVPSTIPAGPPQSALAPTAVVHVVVPGETLHSIARLYHKPVLVLARANNIPPDTQLRIGARIVIPGAGSATLAAQAAPRAEALGPPPVSQNLATADSPHSARVVTQAAPASQEGPLKTVEPVGALASFRWPVRGRVIAGFGPQPNGLQNDGINLAVPEGTPVKAADDGIVAYAGNELKGYGNLVLVRHSNGFVTAYAHASELLVKKGDVVKRGQVIAKSGQTGTVTSPQLHFEIRKGSVPVDPAQYLNGA
ncbi:MAG: peptidoglycan DD-metalloendopeptidase family protein [Xanthobacteraceae bacterium]